MKMEIDYPSDEQVRSEIDHIVAQGLPRRKSIWKRIRGVYFEPGFGIVFYHCNSAWVSEISLYLAVAIFCRMFAADVSKQAVLVFLAFPLLYLLFSFVSCRLEEPEEMLELKRTLHYSLYDLIALRMLYSGVVTILMNCLLLGFLPELGHVELVKLLLAGASSVFVFAALMLSLYFRTGRQICYEIFLVGWSLTSLWIFRFADELCMFLLYELPIVMHAVVAGFAFGMFLILIWKKRIRHADIYEWK